MRGRGEGPNGSAGPPVSSLGGRAQRVIRLPPARPISHRPPRAVRRLTPPARRRKLRRPQPPTETGRLPMAAAPAAPQTVATAANPNSYDEVPYESHPFAQTHPSRLFTVGTLFGLRPTPVAAVPRAGTRLRRRRQPDPDGRHASRTAEFVGVDLSARQIDDGAAARRRELGLKNVEPAARQHPRRGRRLRQVRLHHLPRRLLVGADARAGEDPRDLREAAARRTASPTSATTRTPAGTCAA